MSAALLERPDLATLEEYDKQRADNTWQQVTHYADGSYHVKPIAPPSPDQQAVYNAQSAATGGFTSPDENVSLLAGSVPGAQTAQPEMTPEAQAASIGYQAQQAAPLGGYETPLAATAPAAAPQGQPAAGGSDIKSMLADALHSVANQIAGAPVGPGGQTVGSVAAQIAGTPVGPAGQTVGDVAGAIAGAPGRFAAGAEQAATADVGTNLTGNQGFGAIVDKAGNVIAGGIAGALGAKGSPALPPDTVAPGVLEDPYTASGLSKVPVVGGAIPAALNPGNYLPIGGEAIAGEDALRAASNAAGTELPAAEAAGTALASKLGQYPVATATAVADDTVQRLVGRAVGAKTGGQLDTVQRMVAALPKGQQDAFAEALQARMQPAAAATPGAAAASMGPGTAAPADINLGRPNTGDVKLDAVLSDLQDSYIDAHPETSDPAALAQKFAHAKESLLEAQRQVLDSLGGLSRQDAADAGEILAGKPAADASDAALAAANKVDAIRQVVNDVAERYSAGGLSDVKTTMRGVNEEAVPALLKVSKSAPPDVAGPGGVPSAKLVNDIMDWHEMLTGERPSIISPKELQQFIEERGIKGVQVVADPATMAAKYVGAVMRPLQDAQFAERLKGLAADDGSAAIGGRGAGRVLVPNVPPSLARALTGDAEKAVYATPEVRDAITAYTGRDALAGIAQAHPRLAAILTALVDRPKNVAMQLFTLNPAVHNVRMAYEAASMPVAAARGARGAMDMTGSAAERMAAVRDGLHLPTSRAVAAKLTKVLDAGSDIGAIRTGNKLWDATLGRMSEANHRLTMQTAVQDVQMALYRGLKEGGMPGPAAAKVANLKTGQLVNSDLGPWANWLRSHVASTPSWSTSRLALAKTAIPGLGTRGALLRGLSPAEQQMVIRAVQRSEATKLAEHLAEVGLAQKIMAGHMLPTKAQIESGHALDVDTGATDASGQPIYVRTPDAEELTVPAGLLAKGKAQAPGATPGQRAQAVGKNALNALFGRLSSGLTEPANLARSLTDSRLHPYLTSSPYSAVTPLQLLADKGPSVPGTGSLPVGQSLATQALGLQEIPNYQKSTGLPANVAGALRTAGVPLPPAATYATLPGGRDGGITIPSTRVPLTPEERQQYEAVRGQEMAAILARLGGRFPDAATAKAAISRADQAASARLLKTIPQVRQTAARQATLTKLRASVSAKATVARATRP